MIHNRELIPGSNVPGYLVTVKQAAERTQLHPKTVYRLISEGKIRAWGLRGRYLVWVPDLLPPVEPKRQRR